VTPPPHLPRWMRFLPLAMLAAVGVGAWWSGMLHLLAPSRLADEALTLHDAARRAPGVAVPAFVLVYAVLTGACLPVALMLSLLGGLVFGPWLGGAGVLLGATGGGLLTYAATRSAFAAALVARASRDPRLKRIVDGFGRNAFSYILALRLIPFFPFALVNIGSGLAAAPLRAFAAATLLGGVPTAFLYARLGAGLGETLASERSLLATVRSPDVVVPMAALAVLSLTPILLRRFRPRS